MSNKIESKSNVIIASYCLSQRVVAPMPYQIYELYMIRWFQEKMADFKERSKVQQCGGVTQRK